MEVREGLCYLTADEMRRVDARTSAEFGIGSELLMENAGSAVARLSRAVLGGRVEGRRISCLVGSGNNGGDGLVAARFLRNWGAEVTVVLASGRRGLHDLPLKQLAPVERAGTKVMEGAPGVLGADLVIDALLGYGSEGNPRPPLSDAIAAANSARAVRLAVDVPSGMDATTGEPGDPCVRADYTLTLGFPKTCFLSERGREAAGEVWVGDISIPRELYEELGQRRLLFSQDSVERILGR